MGDVQIGKVTIHIYRDEDGWYYTLNDLVRGPFKGYDDAKFRAIPEASYADEARKLEAEGYESYPTNSEFLSPHMWRRPGRRDVWLALNEHTRRYERKEVGQ